jgi:hypothetical protein
MDDDEEERVIALVVSTVVEAIVEAVQLGVVLDSRAFPTDRSGSATVQHQFWPNMKAKRDPERFRQTLRCEPEAFDRIVEIITPEYETSVCVFLTSFHNV